MTAKQNQTEKTHWRTKDLNQAAFVWCQDGAKMVEVQCSSERGNTIFFKFELDQTEEELRQLLMDYANNETTVEPLAFCEKQVRLRDYLHGGLATQKAKGK